MECVGRGTVRWSHTELFLMSSRTQAIFRQINVMKMNHRESVSDGTENFRWKTSIKLESLIWISRLQFDFQGLQHVKASVLLLFWTNATFIPQSLYIWLMSCTIIYNNLVINWAAVKRLCYLNVILRHSFWTKMLLLCWEFASFLFSNCCLAWDKR